MEKYLEGITTSLFKQRDRLQEPDRPADPAPEILVFRMWLNERARELRGRGQDEFSAELPLKDTEHVESWEQLELYVNNRYTLIQEFRNPTRWEIPSPQVEGWG